MKLGGRATAAIMAGLLSASGIVVPIGMAFADPNTPSAGSQTGSGDMSLNMIMQDSAEHGGTAVDPTNPDDDHDGLGDNLAFTVPSAVNYVVRADGSLVGPSEGVAYIENRSVFPTHVSAMDVDAETGFVFVADASASSTANSVDLQIGPAADMLDASSYLTKADVTAPFEWNMGDAGSGSDVKVLLKTAGDVSHLGKDVTSLTKFGTVKWYVTPGIAVDTTLHSIMYDDYGLSGPLSAHEGDTVTITTTVPVHMNRSLYVRDPSLDYYDERNVLYDFGGSDSVTFVMPTHDIIVNVPSSSPH